MTFSSESAGAKYNSGASREQMENGYEVLDSNADNAIYRETRINPKTQGWRPANSYVNHDDRSLIGGVIENYTD
jgi:hypothetical protein